MIRAGNKSHLVSLSYSLVHKVRKGHPGNEPSHPRISQHLAIFIHHSASGNGYQRNAVALHPLKDVIIHHLVVGLHGNHPVTYAIGLLKHYFGRFC